MSSTLFIACLLILLVIIFILLLKWVHSRENRRDQLQLLHEFDQHCKDNELAINRTDTFGKRMIGIDKVDSKVLFIDKSRGVKELHLFHLRRVSSCEIIRTKAPADNYAVKIGLQCIFKDPDHPAILLGLFDIRCDDASGFADAETKARYWKQEINIYKDFPLLAKG
jgi:hypothetical protein